VIAFGSIALIPLLTGSDFFLEALNISNNAFIIRTGVRFLTFSIMAIGLTVVVGYAGMLDLGFIAYMGIAGYLYAYMSSEFVKIGDYIPNGLAVPAIISIPIIVAIVALIGWIIGSVSIRLAGDYFAIVTLAVGQTFVILVKVATRVELPWADGPVDFTRGQNGINRLDDISFFGYTFQSTLQYFFLNLALLVLVYVVVSNLNRSRIGRSWRAVRDDELAAEVMSIPTRRMKIMAVMIGAGIAAIAGTVDAAFQSNVVPEPRYGAQSLIDLYAMVVLGGIGSLPGAIIGAFTFSVLEEGLRSIQLAGFLFYGVGLLILLRYLRLKKFGFLLGGLIAGGLVLKLAVRALAPAWDAGFPETGSMLNELVQGWLVIPANFKLFGNLATGLMIVMALVTILSRGFARWTLLAVTLYLAAFSWETRLALEAAPTRILFIGFTLVGLMIFRPHGLLGKPEVRVV
jgi:branched-chain amino acid transport system permease protein